MWTFEFATSISASHATEAQQTTSLILTTWEFGAYQVSSSPQNMKSEQTMSQPEARKQEVIQFYHVFIAVCHVDRTQQCEGLSPFAWLRESIESKVVSL